MQSATITFDNGHPDCSNIAFGSRKIFPRRVGVPDKLKEMFARAAISAAHAWIKKPPAVEHAAALCV